MKLRKEISEGSMIPNWYGVAWDERGAWNGDRVRVVVCYPWGLNKIFLYAHLFYWKVAKGSPFRGNPGKAWKDGFYAGYRERKNEE